MKTNTTAAPAASRAARWKPGTYDSTRFGSLLRRARADRSLTLRHVSEASGISITYLSDLERGVLVNPTLETLRAVAAALKVSLNELLGVEGQDSEPKYSPTLEELRRLPRFREAVKEQARRDHLDDEQIEHDWLQSLASIRIGTRKPKTASDLLFIFEAIQRTLERK